MDRDVRVLVVDDDAAIRRLMGRALGRRGFTTVEAADGATALELATSDDFDVILLDYGLPDMAGIDVLRELRGRRSTATTPVLLVTGRGTVPERVEGLSAGATDYLVKPVDLEELVARVEAQLRGREAWRTEVADALTERAALAADLASLEPGDGTEVARQVCGLLGQLPHVDRVAVIDLAASPPARIADSGPGAAGLPAAISPAAVAELRQLVHGRARRLPGGLRAQLLPGSEDPVLALSIEDGVDVVAALVVHTAPTNGADGRRDPADAVADLLPVIDRVLGRSITHDRQDAGGQAGLRAVIADHAFHPVFQPIVRLAGGNVVGYEALTRFADGAPPDVRFVQATDLGLGVELETATLGAALAAAAALPAGRYVSYNVSATLLLHGGLAAILAGGAHHPVVIEITEHERIDDYPAVRAAMAELGKLVRLSVDDAGSGWSSLRHVLSLRPDFVKVDRSWVHEIDTDPARQALLMGIARFVEQMGGDVIAEGIETPAELETLRHLGIPSGQGYLLGHPRPVEELQRV